MKKDLVNLNVRIPQVMRGLLETYIERDLHANISEFTRDALREKIQRDTPQLYHQLFQENIPTESQKGDEC